MKPVSTSPLDLALTTAVEWLPEGEEGIVAVQGNHPVILASGRLDNSTRAEALMARLLATPSVGPWLIVTVRTKRATQYPMRHETQAAERIAMCARLSDLPLAGIYRCRGASRTALWVPEVVVEESTLSSLTALNDRIDSDQRAGRVSIDTDELAILQGLLKKEIQTHAAPGETIWVCEICGVEVQRRYSIWFHERGGRLVVADEDVGEGCKKTYCTACETIVDGVEKTV